MTAAVFVDTNIFVYNRDASEPKKQAVAARWLEELWIEQRGRTGIQVLNEFYVTVIRKLDPGMMPEDAWADVRALFSWNPQPVDRHLLVRAHDVEHRHRCRVQVSEERVRYVATPAPVSRHRPRGRPRRKALTTTD